MSPTQRWVLGGGLITPTLQRGVVPRGLRQSVKKKVGPGGGQLLWAVACGKPLDDTQRAFQGPCGRPPVTKKMPSEFSAD